MKVTLNCSFGDNVAGDTVDLKKEQAQGLIDSGFAHEPSEDAAVTSDSKAVAELKKLREELKTVVSERDKALQALDLANTEITMLKAGQDGKDSKAK